MAILETLKKVVGTSADIAKGAIHGAKEEATRKIVVSKSPCELLHAVIEKNEADLAEALHDGDPDLARKLMRARHDLEDAAGEMSCPVK